MNAIPLRQAFPVLLLILSACASSTAEVRFVEVSGRMPAISGATLDGGMVEPADYSGKVVVVNFWNPDCPPCREEAPVLQADWERLRERGVAVVGVMYVGGNWPDDREAARDYLEEFAITFPNVVDEGSRLARGFGIAGIPTTVVVDREGEMRFRLLGKLRPGSIEELMARLD